MKRAIGAGLTGLAILAQACGGGDAAGNPLIGKWIFNSTNPCGAAVTFTETQYEADRICALDGGNFGIEAEAGTYTTEASTITMVPVLASCTEPGRDHSPTTVGFTVDGNALRLVQPSGVIVFEKFSDNPASVGGGSVAVRYGCADGDQFVFSDLKRL